MAIGGQAGLWPVMLGASIASIVGWMDDRAGLSAGIRLCAEILIIAAILFHAFGAEGLLSPAGIALGLAVLWLVNLFNFMDGSDGLAASQTILCLLPWMTAVHLGMTESTAEADALMLALTGACLAFLFFNRPEARLFMGDAGSLSIPLVAAGIAIFAPDPAESGLILLIGFAGFVTDASLTLALRIIRGERWWAAHRTHAYQLLARRAGGHGAPLAALWLYGALWLTPIAIAAASGRLTTGLALAAAYVPAIGGCAYVQWRYRSALPR